MKLNTKQIYTVEMAYAVPKNVFSCPSEVEILFSFAPLYICWASQ